MRSPCHFEFSNCRFKLTTTPAIVKHDENHTDEHTCPFEIQRTPKLEAILNKTCQYLAGQQLAPSTCFSYSDYTLRFQLTKLNSATGGPYKKIAIWRCKQFVSHDAQAREGVYFTSVQSSIKLELSRTSYISLWNVKRFDSAGFTVQLYMNVLLDCEWALAPVQ